LDACIISKLTKDHLIKARENEEYQVINLITREYYDPAKNQWVKIKEYDV